MKTVAVIDIGSNTIKALVAQSGTPPVPLYEEALDVRISTGISQTTPCLTEDAIRAGTHAVAELLERAKQHKPDQTRIVATSAVRDAQNRDDFAKSIEAATNIPLDILTGKSEALTLDKALACDPFLHTCPNFLSVDLGGGSLEFLHYKDQILTDSISLNIGTVRMTEGFITNPQDPIPAASLDSLSDKVAELIQASAFDMNACKGTQLVGTGGAMSVTRAILAHKKDIDYNEHPSYLHTHEMQKLLEELAAITAQQRAQVPGLPERRADIFPTTLAILLTLAKLTQTDNFYHCPYNLRFGLAKELLG